MIGRTLVHTRAPSEQANFLLWGRTRPIVREYYVGNSKRGGAEFLAKSGMGSARLIQVKMTLKKAPPFPQRRAGHPELQKLRQPPGHPPSDGVLVETLREYLPK